MTIQEFAKGMLILQAGIGRELSAETQRVWFRILGDLTADDWGYAVERYLAESTNAYPMPATLRAFALARSQGDVLTAGEAWGKVVRAIRLYGIYDQESGMASLDEISRAAVRGLGGWDRLCDMEPNERTTTAAQFRMAYEGIAQKREKLRLLPEHLRPATALPAPAIAIGADKNTMLPPRSDSEVLRIVESTAAKLKKGIALH